MNTLSTYLWKEWREQRATLGVLAIVLLAGIAAVVAVLPAKHADDPLVFQGAIAIALLATIMSTGSDLLARERSGARLGFLERAPAGLAMAFRAKLVFFTLTLFSAATYGTLLATAAALLRCGQLPQFLLDGPAPSLLAILLGVSLWVFAVSAWMPASALTFPGTVLLLAVLAWPAVLAMQGDPLYKPTPAQVLALALLCIAGAPISAWVAFVLGSRRGRSRRWSSIAGLSVAAIFFAPTWTWAAGRYASLVNAPFEIQHGWVSPNGQHAFLNLCRRSPPGMEQQRAHAWENCSTAALVDLENHDWRFPGSVDASGFVRNLNRATRQILGDDRGVQYLTLLDGDNQSRFGADSARVLASSEVREEEPQGPSPLEFGLDFVPRNYHVAWAGLGHRLMYLHQDPGGHDQWVTLYRDLEGTVVADRDAILPRDSKGNSTGEILVRPGNWLIRIEKRWERVNPVSYEHQAFVGDSEGDRIGPLLEDGRVLVASREQVSILDPDSGERTRLRLSGRERFALQSIDRYFALPVDQPTVVRLFGRGESTLALLDMSQGALRIQASDLPMRSAILWTKGAVAIVQEEDLRLVRYDVANDQREVLFSVDEID